MSHEPERSEAFEQLLARATRATGTIPATLVVRHVLEVTHGADWPVQREALEAVLRRVSSARADRLETAGRDRTRSARAPRPWRTALYATDPPRGSCNCPDFLRNALGLCKHLVVHLEATLRGDARAARAGRLEWNPVRPLTGEDDWMERIRLCGASRTGDADAAFRADGCLRSTFRKEPERRLDLVRRLLRQARQPALREMLRAEQARLERCVARRKRLPALLASLRSLRRTLYAYQREGVTRFLEAGRLLLADDMGLGKTAQAIASCHALWASKLARRGLVVVPASLKPQWLREWTALTNAPATVIDGLAEDRRGAYRRSEAGFLIVNYEQVIRDLDALIAWKPDVVVLDEAQRMKNWATKTALSVKRLRPEWRLVLTGTPMENRLDELASIVEWVDDFALEPKWRLAPLHGKPVDGPEGIGGARHLDTLRARVGGVLLRRRRAEVLGQLPARTDTPVTVEMTPEQAARHDELDGPIVRLMAIARKRPLTRAEFLRLMSLLTTQRIISNGLAQAEFEKVWPDIEHVRKPSDALLRSLGAPKLGELREIVRALVVEQERKVVVFSQWRRMLKLADWSVRDILAEGGARSAFFTGGEDLKRRAQNIVEFHDDPAMRVLFATDAGGVGLNLQRAANACINLEPPWNPAVLEQRVGRIHRIGQTRPIDVYQLSCDRGIEARIGRLLGGKRALFIGVFDSASDEVTFEHSGRFLERLEQEMEVPRVGGRQASNAAVDAAAEAGDDEPVQAMPGTDDLPAPSAAAPAAEDVRSMLAQLSMRCDTGGRLVIEAPPSAAATLAALFEGMAKLLRGGSPSPA